MDHSGAAPKFMDLVVRNFGATAATDIVLRIDPAPQRATASQEGHEEVWLPDRIRTLVAGQEWREMWDERPATDLPDHHEASGGSKGGSSRRSSREERLG